MLPVAVGVEVRVAVGGVPEMVAVAVAVSVGVVPSGVLVAVGVAWPVEVAVALGNGVGVGGRSPPNSLSRAMVVYGLRV